MASASSQAGSTSGSLPARTIDPRQVPRAHRRYASEAVRRHAAGGLAAEVGEPVAVGTWTRSARSPATAAACARPRIRSHRCDRRSTRSLAAGATERPRSPGFISSSSPSRGPGPAHWQRREPPIGPTASITSSALRPAPTRAIAAAPDDTRGHPTRDGTGNGQHRAADPARVPGRIQRPAAHTLPRRPPCRSRGRRSAGFAPGNADVAATHRAALR